MFINLVESKPASNRKPGGTALSFIAHYGLVLFMIYTSAEAATASEGPKQEKVDFIEPERPVVKKEPPPPDLLAAPLPPKAAPVLVAPIDVPTTIPEIDLRNRITDSDDFARPAPSRAEPGGMAGATATDREFYFEYQLEKPVMQAPNSATPVYPDILRQAGVEGATLVSFVVDTTGRVDPGSLKVVHTTHELFTRAVRDALPRMRFIPAELGEKKVRQLVQQAFSFAIVK
jgi:periplasmic protein TonB